MGKVLKFEEHQKPDSAEVARLLEITSIEAEDAVYLAIEKLPAGYSIEVQICRGMYTVGLRNEKGETVDIGQVDGVPDEREFGVGIDILDSIVAAKRDGGKGRSAG